MYFTSIIPKDGNACKEDISFSYLERLRKYSFFYKTMHGVRLMVEDILVARLHVQKG